jgi:hypothetical protein
VQINSRVTPGVYNFLITSIPREDASAKFYIPFRILVFERPDEIILDKSPNAGSITSTPLTFLEDVVNPGNSYPVIGWTAWFNDLVTPWSNPNVYLNDFHPKPSHVMVHNDKHYSLSFSLKAQVSIGLEYELTFRIRVCGDELLNKVVSSYEKVLPYVGGSKPSYFKVEYIAN